MLFWVLANVLLASSANLFLKLSTRDEELKTQYFLLSYLLNSSSFVVLYFLLMQNGLATNQVLVSSGVICLTSATGFAVFGETLSAMKGVSILLALSSIATMYASSLPHTSEERSQGGREEESVSLSA